MDKQDHRNNAQILLNQKGMFIRLANFIIVFNEVVFVATMYRSWFHEFIYQLMYRCTLIQINPSSAQF